MYGLSLCRVYLYVKLSSPQQVEGGVPHGVRRQRDLLLELLQAVPQLSSSTKHDKQQSTLFNPCTWREDVYLLLTKTHCNKKESLPVFLQLVVNRPAVTERDKRVLEAGEVFVHFIWTESQTSQPHPFLSVISYVIRSPIATSSYLLALLFASLVREIWAERQHWSISMFCLCAKKKKTCYKTVWKWTVSNANCAFYEHKRTSASD